MAQDAKGLSVTEDTQSSKATLMLLVLGLISVYIKDIV